MYMGTFDAQVTRQNDVRGGVPGSIVNQLNADPQVLQYDPLSET